MNYRPRFALQIRQVMFLCVLLHVFVSLVVGRAHADARPNFVIFIADDVSASDLGCYGNALIETPNIDKLASEGIVFTNAYLTISSCSPSRTSILTGRYPHNTGASELHRLLPESQTRFPQLLRDAGYYTALSGKIHGITDTDPAFEYMSDGGWPEHPGASEDWVKIAQDRPKDVPFLFWFASIDAHRDWQFSEDIRTYDPDNVVVPPYMKDEPQTRSDLASYYHEISRFDHYIGRVIEVLKRQGVYDDTLIIIIADNGRPFYGAKGRLYDSGIKTPLVIRYSSLIKSGTKSSSLVSSIDIAPSVLDIAGITTPTEVQGVSFVPVLHNPQTTSRDVVFAESNWHVFKAHERLVRFGDIAYIRNNYPTHHSNFEYISSLHDRVTGELRDAESNSPVEQLFILDKDPYQQVNQADNPEYRQDLHLARRLLEQWSEQTGDSIPTHPTPDRDPTSEIRNPHREQPGESRNATEIDTPGPIRILP